MMDEVDDGAWVAESDAGAVVKVARTVRIVLASF